MSDHRRPPARLIGSHTLSWLTAATWVLVAAVLLLSAYLATRPDRPADAANREQHLRLRLEIEAKAQEALAKPARNPDGTYRVPIDQVLALAAKDPRRLDAVREQALREQAAGK